MEIFSKYPQYDKILSSYGKTQEDMISFVAILREWMQKLPHIPTDSISSDFLEITLIQNKLSVEKTKQKIEKYCTFKSLNRYQYLFVKELFVPSKEPIAYVPLPKLTDNNYRIICGRLKGEDEYDILRDMNNAIIMREIYSNHDFNNGEINIVDYSLATSKMLKHIKPNILMDALKIVTDIFSTRVKEIHLISKVASVIFTAAKPLLPSKIANRIFIHENVDELKNVISPQFLPSDYGGELKSLNEYVEDFDKYMEAHKEEILGYINIRSREELRVGDKLFDDMQGTFRKLNID